MLKNWLDSVLELLRGPSKGTGAGSRADFDKETSALQGGVTGNAMRIYFERTGGFAGMRLSTTIDTSELNPEEAEMLEAELERASFFDLPPHIDAQEGADRFTYRIGVRAGDKQHTVEVSESAAPDELCPLLEHLERLLRTQRSSQ